MKKIYLAGPDVFLPHAKEHGETLKQLCLKAGFMGLFPLDNEITGDSLLEIATKIQKENIKMIHACDIVLANLSPFRGPEPDSGTVWEVGYAQALGKQVFAYSNDMRSLKEKAIDALHLLDNAKTDNENNTIEDFGLTHNLMFSNRVVATTFMECLNIIQKTV
ncbi:MAG: nucleoside 2-deoxyribosyltransferase [Candidatus Marinarcus sp.]|uniref:nucleoside 2-deoxyribosyltransferase n=1 Tax=Candidatus Marinarcus sp. TaxID=3100987 RepID=UPI003AFFF73D